MGGCESRVEDGLECYAFLETAEDIGEAGMDHGKGNGEAEGKAEGKAA